MGDAYGESIEWVIKKFGHSWEGKRDWTSLKGGVCGNIMAAGGIGSAFGGGGGPEGQGRRT
jgi:hypothetical protein